MDGDGGIMKVNPIELISLEADDGMILTNGSVYSHKVYLGIHDKPENWTEVVDTGQNMIEEPEEIEE